MAENKQQFNLPKLKQLPKSTFNKSWKHDIDFVKYITDSLISIDSMVNWFGSSTPQRIVYVGVQSLLNSLVSFGVSIKTRRVYFCAMYGIDGKLPQELQDILNGMDGTFNHIQTHYLELTSYLLPSTLSNLKTVLNDVDRENFNLTEEKMSSAITKNMENLDLNRKKAEKLSTITNNGQKTSLLKRFYNAEEVNKCKNLLLEVEKVDCVLLQKYPGFTTKYSKTIDDIIHHADLLTKYKVFLPKLFLLLAYSQQNYSDFEKEKDFGLYNDCTEAALKLEKSIETSIVNIQKVMKKLEMTFNENDY